MTEFNPDFWEVTIASEGWSKFSAEDRLWHEPEEDRRARHDRAERAASLRPELLRMMDELLTGRQRQVVMLYFFEELNQRQIAERLGISQQSVSERLYGKVRNGSAVGGAIRKLRRACAERGVTWR